MPPPVVLVAEDEPTVRGVVAECLRDEDYKVREVATGRLALELVRQERVDVVLADIRMPDLGGRGLYDALRLFRRDLCEAFIVITGCDDREIEFFLRVSVPVIRKPFSLAVLTETIDAVLQRRSGAITRSSDSPGRDC